MLLDKDAQCLVNHRVSPLLLQPDFFLSNGDTLEASHDRIAIQGYKTVHYLDTNTLEFVKPYRSEVAPLEVIPNNSLFE